MWQSRTVSFTVAAACPNAELSSRHGHQWQSAGRCSSNVRACDGGVPISTHALEWWRDRCPRCSWDRARASVDADAMPVITHTHASTTHSIDAPDTRRAKRLTTERRQPPRPRTTHRPALRGKEGAPRPKPTSSSNRSEAAPLSASCCPARPSRRPSARAPPRPTRRSHRPSAARRRPAPARRGAWASRSSARSGALARGCPS